MIRNEQINNVQILRALAAIMVAFYHLRLPLGSINSAHDSVAGYCASGVDIFFVISGFIMTVTTHSRNVDTVDFLRLRLIRIAPLYLIMTIICFGLMLIKPSAFSNSDQSVAHFIKSLFFLPDWTAPVLQQGWTLNIEMFFYLIFSAGLLSSRHSMMKIAVPLSIILFLVVIGLLFEIRSPAWYLITNAMMLEFLFGMALGLAWPLMPMLKSPIAKTAVLLGCVILFVTIFLVPFPKEGHQKYFEPLVWGLPSFGIVGCVLLLEKSGWIVRSKFLLALGAASYSIYLTHVFVTRAYEKMPKVVPLEGNLTAAFAFAAAVMAVVIVVGLSTHKYLEIPLNRVVRKVWRARRAAQEPAREVRLSELADGQGA